MTVLGHIAGIPVEETILGILPLGVVGIGAIAYAARTRARGLRRSAARRFSALRALTSSKSGREPFNATAAGRLAPGATQASQSPRSGRRPDQVIQWNQEMLQLLAVPGAQPPTIHPSRTMAITQLAVDDAVDAILGGSRPYLPRARAPIVRASPDAAAASAARTRCSRSLPSQVQAIDARFQDSISQIGVRTARPRGHPRRRASRRSDPGAPRQRRLERPAAAVHAAGRPGEYQLTPPLFLQPVFTQLGRRSRRSCSRA